MKDLFYLKRSEDAGDPPGAAPPGYDCRIWTPAEGGLRPPGVTEKAFAVWRLFHALGVFSNREYGVFVAYHGDALAHRSGIFPRYFRFPFMGADDLQIGDTWTAPEHRGRGLSSYALRRIMSERKNPGRAFWYLEEQGHAPSIRAAEKAGTRRAGEGRRTKRLGLSLLGRYVMDRRDPDSPDRRDPDSPATDRRDPDSPAP